MSITRRGFLGAAGLSALALASKPALEAMGFEAVPQEPTSATSGTRWAMVVDPRKCLDQGECTKCMDACDHAHNVPHFTDPAHEVKWIWKEPFEDAFPSLEIDRAPDDLRGQPFVMLCNHCDNPPCVRVCPTQATWKRTDGIVMMDWHRCIGCRYCMAACPYGSRSFNWSDPRAAIHDLNPDYPTRTKGVVEKCTFCEERLAVGQRPTCCDVCPAKALVFGNLDDPASEVRTLLRARFAVRRKAELGTRPAVYYLL